MSNSASQGIYSPLPQSISDTDSEEELHSTIPIQSSKLDNLNKSNGTDLRNYHHLDDTDDGHINGFPNINASMLDSTPIIKDGYKRPLTPIRKFFFSLSILICFLTIVIFLWILPCTEDATCPTVRHNARTTNWEKAYHGIELMGPINVVNGVKGYSKNLVFLFRGDVINSNPVQGLQNIPLKGGGAISIMGDTGKVAWYVPRQRLPTDIDCTLLDVDSNGDMDCIMYGEGGLLEVINPLSGGVHWHVHIHNKTNTLVTSIDFPLLIPDLDNDNVNELLASCSLNGSRHNILIVISGRTGNVIGRPYVDKDCDAIHNLGLDKSYVSYSCHVGTEIKNPFIPLHEFYARIFNNLTMRSVIVKQHSRAEPKSNQRMIYSVNGRQLIISNQGHCPGNCNVSVQLIDQRYNRVRNVTWSRDGTNMYGMVPTSLTFKSTENNMNSLQGHINGFILKFWQWYDPKPERFYAKDYFGGERLVKRSVFDDLMDRKLSWHLPVARLKRSLPLDKKNFTIVEQTLTEHVVLITFNSTNVKVINASQSEIKQLCLHTFERTYCQPDLSFQENSVLITDLDEDGSKELVSYMSTFSISDDGPEDDDKYQLQSNVKVIRLESELPKLYEAVTKY